MDTHPQKSPLKTLAALRKNVVIVFWSYYEPYIGQSVAVDHSTGQLRVYIILAPVYQVGGYITFDSCTSVGLLQPYIKNIIVGLLQ